MSTKETLPTVSIFDEFLKETGQERLHYNACSCEWCKSTKHHFSEWQTTLITALRTRLDAAEKELEKTKERLSEVSKGTLMVENLRLKEANAELMKDKERLDWLENYNWTPDSLLNLMYSVNIRQAIDASHRQRNAMSENEANTVVDALKSLADDHMRLQARVEELGKENNALKARIERLAKALENLTHITSAGEVRVDYYKEAKAVLEEG